MKDRTFKVDLTYLDASLIQDRMSHYPHLGFKVYIAQEKEFRNSVWSIFKNRLSHKSYKAAFNLVMPWNIKSNNVAADKFAIDIWNKAHPNYKYSYDCSRVW